MSKRGFIFLTGFMGTGKSAVGRQLAKLIGMPFIEMDEEIEKTLGMKIKDIFGRYGEDFFRDKETEALKKITEGPSAVVSTGGGVVIRPENRQLMKARGRVVCLWADVETIFKRVCDGDDRPLLNVPNRRDRIMAILQSRIDYYKDADLHIQTDDKSPYEIAVEIKKALDL